MENQTIQPTNINAGQGMGIAALVLGILGIITSIIPCFGFFALIFGVLAIIFGAIGLNQARQMGGRTGLPLTGLILGIIAAAFTIIWLLLITGAVLAGSSMLHWLH